MALESPFQQRNDLVLSRHVFQLHVPSPCTSIRVPFQATMHRNAREQDRHGVGGWIFRRGSTRLATSGKSNNCNISMYLVCQLIDKKLLVERLLRIFCRWAQDKHSSVLPSVSIAVWLTLCLSIVSFIRFSKYVTRNLFLPLTQILISFFSLVFFLIGNVANTKRGISKKNVNVTAMRL